MSWRICFLIFGKDDESGCNFPAVSMKRLYEVNITDTIHICKSDFIRENRFYKSDFVYLRKT